MTHAAVAVALSPGWCALILRGWSLAASPAHAESLQQSTFLLLVSPKAGARSQCGGARAARLLPRHKPARACIRCSAEDLPRSKPFPELWCALRSACGWTRPKRASAGIDWSGLYLRAGAPAAGARFLYKETRTGLLRSARRKSRAWLSPCNVQT